MAEAVAVVGRHFEWKMHFRLQPLRGDYAIGKLFAMIVMCDDDDDVDMAAQPDRLSRDGNCF